MFYNYAKNPIFERITINRQRRNLELGIYQNQIMSDNEVVDNYTSPLENSGIKQNAKRALSPNEQNVNNLQFDRSRLFSQQNNSALGIDFEQKDLYSQTYEFLSDPKTTLCNIRYLPFHNKPREVKRRQINIKSEERENPKLIPKINRRTKKKDNFCMMLANNEFATHKIKLS